MPEQERRLEMYGGLLGGMLPLLTLVVGLIWLSVAERGGTKPFWACAWIALAAGLFLARNKEDYCLAAANAMRLAGVDAEEALTFASRRFCDACLQQEQRGIQADAPAPIEETK